MSPVGTYLRWKSSKFFSAPQLGNIKPQKSLRLLLQSTISYEKTQLLQGEAPPTYMLVYKFIH